MKFSLPRGADRSPVNVSGGLLTEFREFVARGNFVDLTVGFSVGSAFTALSNSFIQDLLLPPLRRLMASAQTIAIDATGNAVAPDFNAAPTGLSAFGAKLGSFLLVAVATFLVVKAINRLRRTLEARASVVSPKSEAAPAVEDPTVRQIAQNERIIALLEELVTANRKTD